ncbi:hypothetical protein FWC31_02065 [Candidatus Saccharibacteria bacterium]|nr:hypothetical protein [Candidatus Saccharibacteria bacterium]
MALVKIYSLPNKKQELVDSVAKNIKSVVAKALNTPEIPTDEGGVETVFVEGIDLINIDYIMEIIAIERPNQQRIADNIIADLNEIYPNIKFSVYFNLISETGMANTPRD